MPINAPPLLQKRLFHYSLINYSGTMFSFLQNHQFFMRFEADHFPDLSINKQDNITHERRSTWKMLYANNASVSQTTSGFPQAAFNANISICRT